MISVSFPGSKRYYIKPVEELVRDKGYKTVYEPFGGSAVLSVNLFNDGIVEKAVVNDYDGFFDLYPEYLDIKDDLVSKLWARGAEKTFPGDGKRLSPENQEFVKEYLQGVDQKLWPMLAYNFVFSARLCGGAIKPIDFKYFHYDLTTINQRAYLDLINQTERVQMDYKDFFDKYKNDMGADTLLIIDPPYLNSAQSQYSNDSFFGVAETIDILKRAKETGSDFIFFNMRSNDTRALLDLIGFNVCEFQVKKAMQGAGKVREDVMAYIRQ